MFRLRPQQNIVIGLLDIHLLPSGNQIVWATSFILSDSRHWYHKSTYTVLKKASQQATLLFWILASQLNAWKRMLVERPRPEKQQKREKVSGIVISVSQEKIKYTDSFILLSTG